MEEIEKKKECFGILNKVFPMGEDGLRHVPESCFECKDRVDCLRDALSSPEGLDMRKQVISRAERGGLIGWLKRWSQLKELDNIRKRTRNK